MKFLYAIHQHSEKRIDIHCKVTFGFMYINLRIDGYITYETDLYSLQNIVLENKSFHIDFNYDYFPFEHVHIYRLCPFDISLHTVMPSA